MERLFASIIILALFSNCAHNLLHYRHYQKTEQITISVRVGQSIDPEERVQFDLFPDIEGFKVARFYGVAEGGYEVRIETESKRLVAVNRDSLAVMILRDYINRYEEIQNAKSDFEEDWKIVDYDELALPITQHELNCIRKPGSGRIIGGATCCVGGGITSLALAELSGEHELISEDVGDVVFFGTWVASTATGAILGEKILRNRALSAIKESRKPRIIE